MEHLGQQVDELPLVPGGGLGAFEVEVREDLAYQGGRCNGGSGGRLR